MSSDELRLPAGSYATAFHAAPVALLLIAADGLIMVDANAKYLEAVGMPADQVLGRHVFDVFPAPPAADPETLDLPAYFRRTIESRKQQVVQAARYDIPVGDGFDTRWWNVVETPILDDAGDVEMMLHYTEDVTALVRARAEMTRLEAAKDVVARQVASLAEVSLALSSAMTVEEVERVVSGALKVLAVDGAAIVVPAPDGTWRVSVSDVFTEELQQTYAFLPFDSVLPGAVTARTGQRILMLGPTADLDEETRVALAAAQRSAFAVLPLNVEGQTIGSLTVTWIDEHPLDDAELDLLEGFTAQCAQALHRIAATEAERRSLLEMADMAEALQQALLTPPPQQESLEIAVRYQSASDSTQVGGDWYDALPDEEGSAVLVIGDVVGHDSAAAARMGQLRGILRTLAYLDHASPADVLVRLEHTARGLGVDALATAVVARIETVAGARVLHWSNAGHPPPMLLTADGGVQVLHTEPELLLGVAPDRPRHDHQVDLPPGATVLLYTDGLIERRDAGLDDGIADLSATLAELADVSLEWLCDRLLDRLAPHTGADDIALLAVRVR